MRQLILLLAAEAAAFHLAPTTYPKPAIRVPLHRHDQVRLKAPTAELAQRAAAGASIVALAASLPAEAAVPVVANAVPSALAAYGHYLGFILSAGSLVAERVTIKPGMTEEDFDLAVAADAVYGVAGLIILGSGYLRVTQYGKGWDFYQHEPIFWLKLTLLAVMGASSFFPTIKLIQRSVAKRNGEEVAPMSDKLIARMTSIINAELLAVISIPLTATLMARGVGYAEWLPWYAGAAPVTLALGGLGYKYVKEALDWKDD